MVSSVSSHIPEETADYDEVSMQESLIFSDSLKEAHIMRASREFLTMQGHDLKNLRTQLYSAAEYFELSYTNDDEKQIVVDRLKDYAIEAVLNTVDHLGSATYKVNDLLDEKVDEVSDTELRVSCIEQRIRTCQQHIDREGLSQQSLVINTPKYHKRYILPVGKATTEAIGMKPKNNERILEKGDERHRCRKAVRSTTIRDNHVSSIRKGRSPSPSPRPLRRASTNLSNGSTTRKESDKQAVSPHRFPLIRTGSLSSRPSTPNSRATTPNRSQPTTPNAFNGIQRYSSAHRKSASMHFCPELGRESPKEIEQQPRKSRSFLKSLLGRRKMRRDETLYTYLDEY